MSRSCGIVNTILDIMKYWARLIITALVAWVVFAAAFELGKFSADNRAGFPGPQRVRIEDLGELQKYRTANSQLGPDPSRVVFFGDSITYLWKLQKSFPTRNYINRGIGGQTSADMLVRFREDVIDLHPKTVVILAGINDFFWRTERSDSDEQTLANLEANDQTMAELAELHHIRLAFVSILPVHNYGYSAKITYARIPKGVVVRANEWLKGLCAQHGYQYIDYYSAMVDDHGMLREELSDDGIHPNQAGYSTMARVFSSSFKE
jgi:lysophospholipase L1-like esterase